MNCNDILPLLSPYIDEMLEPSACIAVEDHLAACSSCHLHCEHLRSLRKMVSTFETVSAPSGLSDEILTKVAAENKKMRTQKRPLLFRYWHIPSAVAACFLIFVVLWGQTETPQIPLDGYMDSIAVEMPSPDLSEPAHTPLPTVSGGKSTSVPKRSAVPTGLPPSAIPNTVSPVQTITPKPNRMRSAETSEDDDAQFAPLSSLIKYEITFYSSAPDAEAIYNAAAPEGAEAVRNAFAEANIPFSETEKCTDYTVQYNEISDRANALLLESPASKTASVYKEEKHKSDAVAEELARLMEDMAALRASCEHPTLRFLQNE